MNSGDPFERRLERQTLRPAPPGWRQEILQAARAAAPAGPRRFVALPVRGWLEALLWPNPRAWASLAALWLLALSLNLAGRESSGGGLAAGPAAPSSPERRELFRQQEQLLAELAGPVRKLDADRPKPPVAQPHSERRGECLNA